MVILKCAKYQFDQLLTNRNETTHNGEKTAIYNDYRMIGT